MNRNMASLLFLAAAVFLAGCSSHTDSFGEAGSSGSSGSGSTGSTGSTGGSATPSETDDLATFARAGIVDPEYVDARLVNDINFVSDENPDAFSDVF
jgi:hypothetical protein